MSKIRLNVRILAADKGIVMKYPITTILSAFVLCIFHTAPIVAAVKSKPLHFYFGISGGLGVTHVGETTTVNLASSITNQYATNNAITFIPFFGGNLGYEFLLSKSVMMGLGLGGYYFNFNNNTDRGVVHPYYNLSNDFDTLNFQYKATSTALWGESRFSFGRRLWQPYLFLGMGFSANYLSNYLEQASNNESSAAPMLAFFKENNQLAFSYGIGFGATRSFAHSKGKFGLEYRYFNFGEGMLQNTSLQTTSDGLSTGTLYAHTLIFSLLFR